ncbi:MAG: hypothetical protein ABUT20_59065 [Bacteroidota bacterium]
MYVWVNYLYLDRGAENNYMVNGARIASKFKKAIRDSTIHDSTKVLYIVELQRYDPNESEIDWSIGEGLLFKFYQGQKKKIIFVDSVYQRFSDSSSTVFKNFDTRTSQFVYLLPDKIIDLTENFIEDTLKEISPQAIARTVLMQSVSKEYLQKDIQIDQDNFKKFITSGFHDKEGGFRWSSGNASIEFTGGYRIDTGFTLIRIGMFLPPACKDILPRVSITDLRKEITEIELVDKTEGEFIYAIRMNKIDTIKMIRIISDTINSGSDQRMLSFPFRNLLIQKSTVPLKNLKTN